MNRKCSSNYERETGKSLLFDKLKRLMAKSYSFVCSFNEKKNNKTNEAIKGG